MRISYNSPVVLSFTLLCTLVLLIESVFQTRFFTELLFTVRPTFNFFDPFAYIRIIGHIVGHANWAHLLGNFTFILLIGPILEEKYGSKPILVMMFLTALITGLLNVLFASTSLLGASGIVFMFIVLSSITNIKKGEIPLTFILVAFLFLGKEFLNAFNNDQVSQFAHIIGGICGGFFGLNYSKSIA